MLFSRVEIDSFECGLIFFFQFYFVFIVGVTILHCRSDRHWFVGSRHRE